MSLEADQRAYWHAQLSYPFGAPELRQVNDKAGGEHVGADLLEQLACGLGRAAGSDEIVDQDHPFALENRVLVHFHLVDSVFERVANADAFKRQFSLLADRHEAGRHLMGNGATQNEPSRLDPRDLVDLAAGPRLHQLIDRTAESPRIAKERGDVAKHDAGLWIIRD